MEVVIESTPGADADRAPAVRQPAPVMQPVPVTQPAARPPAARPCGFCRRPVPQAPGQPPRRFCVTGPGPSACEAAAAEQRERGLAAPGLGGHVARAWDLVERLESTAALLSGALDGELTVAGVEARMAQLRAETAAVEAEAHRAADAARARAEEALAAADAQRRRADEAEALAADLRGRLSEAAAGRDQACRRFEQLARTAEEVNAALAAARADRARQGEQISELSRTLQASLEEVKRLRADLVTAQGAEKAAREQAATVTAELRQQRLRLEEVSTERARALQDAHQARTEARAEHTARVQTEQHARDAREQIQDALLQRDRALESTRSAHERLDQTRASLGEQQAELDEQARLIEELRARAAMLIAERDAARNEAERARWRIDQFITRRQQGGDVQNVAAVPRPPDEAPDHRPPDGTVSILHRLPPVRAEHAPTAVNGDH
ncbi:hypothetical protein [Actinomadura verrucosospora]|uniref:Chromosome segregation ATPase-like protein n=1 Tax=Actinomadura verrucosospora TaxID=46165 RepID=A0A7D3ZPS3_ACTVE|nr:hypothetical protein [Actinomadura verrucosospora]QKG24323.1 Chromosome segregation ATPase-like protein [Actinomadura verrucosospora]